MDDTLLDWNRRFWTRQVQEGNVYTRPWLDLDARLLLDWTEGRIDTLPEPYAYIYPRFLFQGVAGKDILCLATAGGQQSAVFGLLGARVTVFDLCEAQLEGDRAAAERHGYSVTLVQGDMRDLSAFPNGTFDLVCQEISLVFVPDVRPVYREVWRVLRPRGRYRVGHCNPATYAVAPESWDGHGYRIDTPYRGGPTPVAEGEAMETRHLLSDIFNPLADTGFRIEGVWEDPRHLVHREAAPGSYEHMLTMVGAYHAIVAAKPLD